MKSKGVLQTNECFAKQVLPFEIAAKRPAELTTSIGELQNKVLFSNVDMLHPAISIYTAHTLTLLKLFTKF
jgi:hypothetical protein